MLWREEDWLNKQLRLTIISLILVSSIIPMYKAKSKLGVNILPGPHTPDLVEEVTGGLFKARWVDRNYIHHPHFHLTNLIDWKG